MTSLVWDGNSSIYIRNGGLVQAPGECCCNPPPSSSNTSGSGSSSNTSGSGTSGGSDSGSGSSDNVIFCGDFCIWEADGDRWFTESECAPPINEGDPECQCFGPTGPPVNGESETTPCIRFV